MCLYTDNQFKQMVICLNGVRVKIAFKHEYMGSEWRRKEHLKEEVTGL